MKEDSNPDNLVENKINNETIFNSFDLKKQIILGLALSLFTAIGYIVKTEYFDKKNIVEKYIVDSHKKLYKQGSTKFQNINNSYIKITNYLSQNYGTTIIEIEKGKVFNDFYKTRNELHQYKKELEKYSSDTFIISIDNVINLINSDMFLIETLKISSKMIEDKISNILYIKNQDNPPELTKELIEEIKKAIFKDLDELISLENDLYFRFFHFSSPLIDGLESNFNNNFRDILGLNKLNSPIQLNKLINDWKQYKYTNKENHYTLANMRVNSAPQLELKGDFFKPKNEYLKLQVLIKFIMSATAKTYTLDKKEAK